MANNNSNGNAESGSENVEATGISAEDFGTKITADLKIMSVEHGQTAFDTFESCERSHGAGTKLVREMLVEYGVDKTTAENVRADLYTIADKGNFPASKKTIRLVSGVWMKDAGYSSRNSSHADDTVETADGVETEVKAQQAENEGMSLASAMAVAVGNQVAGDLLVILTDNEKQFWGEKIAAYLRKVSRNKPLQARIAELISTVEVEPEPQGEADAADEAGAEAEARTEAELAKITAELAEAEATEAKIEAANKAGKGKGKRGRKTATVGAE